MKFPSVLFARKLQFSFPISKCSDLIGNSHSISSLKVLPLDTLLILSLLHNLRLCQNGRLGHGQPADGSFTSMLEIPLSDYIKGFS